MIDVYQFNTIATTPDGTFCDYGLMPEGGT